MVNRMNKKQKIEDSVAQILQKNGTSSKLDWLDVLCSDWLPPSLFPYLTLKDITLLIKPERLNILMLRGLENFIMKNKKVYSFCPKVSCKNILLLKNFGDYNSTKCEICNHIYCRLCMEEYHPKKTCEENKEMTLKIFKNLNIKRCPECSYAIEKKDGCNHVQCVCKIHFCWLCLQKFENDDLTYRHLNSVHGSIN